MDKDGMNKRKADRLRVNLSIVYRINKPITLRMMIGNKEVRTTMFDLSGGGLSILADRNIPVGARLLMKFTLFKVEADDVSFYGPMEILGEVRYSTHLAGSEYRLGIAFKRIAGPDKTEIENFVKATRTV
jgi:c-di-GMP-binding flagellar brake protein YcgR